VRGSRGVIIGYKQYLFKRSYMKSPFVNLKEKLSKCHDGTKYEFIRNIVC